jgi:ribosomal protein S18 acetylase RimI-like enzyme
MSNHNVLYNNIEEDLSFEPLDRSLFELFRGFSCGVHSIDAYLMDEHQGLMNQGLGLSSTTVVLLGTQVVAFVSACCNSLEINEVKARSLGLDEELSVPAIEVTHLGVHREFRYIEGQQEGYGIGKIVMQNLIAPIYELQSVFAARYIFVWSTQRSIGFYEKLQFRLMNKVKDGLYLMRFKIPRGIYIPIEEEY